ncbi:TorF family putative porin [Azotobacter beijerinckii]|uniref:Uncharacterized protein n=1 Tax=Azotobacter beijerinckii TaxID=170623 RepID=A0A1I3Z0M8_9GAMM|nr:TorF family putative porin [Azotobacter beijerinckii]SFA74226.1 conserved hypothetical protein [Azotobacter beijerinckii]SFK37627.1 conserved hypothetical protein [Azotobacter beijerinckii]
MTLKHYALTTLATASLTLAADQPRAMPHTFTASLGPFSEYRFRGIDQTFDRPALQGGFDCNHAVNWNANVGSGPGCPGCPGGCLEGISAVAARAGAVAFPGIPTRQ